MSRRDILLLLAVAVVWGINFAVIKRRLGSTSPGKVAPFSLLVLVTGLPGASLFGKKQ